MEKLLLVIATSKIPAVSGYAGHVVMPVTYVPERVDLTIIPRHNLAPHPNLSGFILRDRAGGNRSETLLYCLTALVLVSSLAVMMG